MPPPGQPPVTQPSAGAGTDVLVVGFGPVGQVLALLLGRAGHHVQVVERWSRPYPRPRAVHYDDEIARILASVGLGAQLSALSEPCDEYDWQAADGRTLLHFDWSEEGPSAWPGANMFCQPELEALLTERVLALPTVTLLRDARAVEFLEDAAGVTTAVVSSRGARRSVRARYVVGCDGADSVVRERMGTGLVDLGFSYDWLILDVIPHQPRRWRPVNLQICDPSRPTSLVSGGPGRRRWEFMRLPAETREELDTEATAWRLLARWGLSAENATLERHTVYTFQARWAEQWRRGRLLIAGDAAHLMPPFAGQGLCCGIRDAANLAWKLDAVLSGLSPDGLLDTYTSERSPQVRQAIQMSVDLGNVICLTDPVAAAQRDEAMLALAGTPQGALPRPPSPPLGAGVLQTPASPGPAGAVGTLVPQGRVSTSAGDTGRFDQIVGTGWVVLVAAGQTPEPGPEVRQVRHRLGAHLVQLCPAGTPDAPVPPGVLAVVDTDGVYTGLLAQLGAAAIIWRPDFYLFGTAPRLGELPGLLADLLRQLGLAVA